MKKCFLARYIDLTRFFGYVYAHDGKGIFRFLFFSKKAFSDCKEAIVRLPASVQTIDRGAFEHCKIVVVPTEEIKQKVKDSLYHEERIVVGNLVIDDGLYFADAGKTILIGCDGTKQGEITIPASVIKIAGRTFSENEKITSVNLSGCTSLTCDRRFGFFRL